MISRIVKSPITKVTLGTGAIGSAIYLYDEKRRRHAIRIANAGWRITNLVLTAGVMVTDYTYNLYFKYTKELEVVSQRQDRLKQLQKDQETYLKSYMRDRPNRAQWWEKVVQTRKIMDDLTEEINELYRQNRDLFYSDLHRRNALRLRDMCASNGGIYVKLGQHIAMLDHVVPREYRQHLTCLLADTPPSSYDSIERIFQEDFNSSPKEIFDSFETKPIASASLAQVHIAYKDGKKYAVKVQHEGLRDGAAADLLVITKIVDVLSHYFEDFNYRWLTREMNYNLPLELDFLKEIGNILQVKRDLKDMVKSGDVALPTPIEPYSSQRILTMSFEEGFHLNNVEQMKSLKLKGIDVSTLVSQIFSEQIFRHGFVHCDPHEANLLFRPHPTKKGKPQIVLLDHGLYRRLDENFRKSYARLWQSIILADEKGIEQYGKELSSGRSYALLAAVLTLKPWDSVISGETEEDG
jgi:aarF domain-containing kinase